MNTKDKLKIPRQKMPEQSPKERIKNFKEVPFGLTAELAMKEAQRCLQCKKAVCVDGCPVEINIPEFIRLIAEGDFIAAAKELKKNNIEALSDQEMDDLAVSLSFSDMKSLYAAVGSGDTSAKQVLTRLLPRKEEKVPIVRKFLEKAKGRAGIRIQGLGNLMFRFAQCCQPLPGEEIVGFITKGRGVSVHRGDCPNALQMMVESDRRVDVQWDVQKDQSFLVKLEVMLEDRKGLLHDITEAVADADTNIRGAEIKPSEPPTHGSLLIEVKNLRHLNKAVKKIKRVKGVIMVERAKGMEE